MSALTLPDYGTRKTFGPGEMPPEVHYGFQTDDWRGRIEQLGDSLDLIKVRIQLELAELTHLVDMP